MRMLIESNSQVCIHQGWRSLGLASVSRPASRRNFNGLGLGLSCPCLGLGGPAFVYRVSRTGLETTGLGLEAGLETKFRWPRSRSWSRHPCLGLGLGLGGPGLDYNPDIHDAITTRWSSQCSFKA